MFGHIKKGKG